MSDTESSVSESEITRLRARLSHSTTDSTSDTLRSPRRKGSFGTTITEYSRSTISQKICAAASNLLCPSSSSWDIMTRISYLPPYPCFVNGLQSKSHRIAEDNTGSTAGDDGAPDDDSLKILFDNTYLWNEMASFATCYYLLCCAAESLSCDGNDRYFVWSESIASRSESLNPLRHSCQTETGSAITRLLKHRSTSSVVWAVIKVSVTVNSILNIDDQDKLSQLFYEVRLLCEWEPQLIGQSRWESISDDRDVKMVVVYASHETWHVFCVTYSRSKPLEVNNHTLIRKISPRAATNCLREYLELVDND